MQGLTVDGERDLHRRRPLAQSASRDLLLRGLLKAGVYRTRPGWIRYALRLVVATTAMVAAVLALTPELATWLDWHWTRRVGQMALLCGTGVVVYFAAHWLLGTRVACNGQWRGNAGFDRGRPC